MTTEEKFRAAVNVIRSLPKNGSYQPSPELMLRFYAYYKQATEGPCQSTRPGFWEMIKKAKWDAWNRLGNMSREEAMENYVEELKKIVETMSYTENVAQFLESLDSFYEKVPAEDLNLLVGNIVERVVGSSGESSPLRPSSPAHAASVATNAARFGSSFGTSPASSCYSPSPQPPASLSDRDTEDEEDEFIDTMEDGAGSPPTMNGSVNGVDASKRNIINTPTHASNKSQLIESELDANHNHRQILSFPVQVSEPEAKVNGNYIHMNGNSKVLSSPGGGGDAVISIPQASPFNTSVYDSYVDERPTNGGGYADLVGGRTDSPLNGYADGSARTALVQNGSHPVGRVNGVVNGSREEESVHSVRQLVLDLQNDLDMIRNRLRSLEKSTTAKTQRSTDFPVSRSQKGNPAWWPFPELSPQTAAFLVVWPFAVHLFISYVRRRSTSNRP